MISTAGHRPSPPRRAVTFGRYQMVTTAHLATVTAILKDWAYSTIGVLDLTYSGDTATQVAGLPDFYRDCANNCAPKRNPLTLTERISCWRAAIDHAGLADRVDVVVLPRPELYPHLFNALFPAHRFDVVFPHARRGGTTFDAGRNQNFTTILGRTIHTVNPQFELHTSAIRRLLVAGDPRWDRGLAPGVAEVFARFCGPTRMSFL